ncbi:MAG: glycosyltransferase [Verrucomicrobia bacterium]|nr:glycosyltransferase [Verrucomicrobiota bacterium]
MLKLLEKRNFCAEVVCPGGGPLEENLHKLGVKHHHLEFGKYAFSRRPDWHFAFYSRFRKILKESRPEVVVINLDGNTPLVTLAAVRAGIPIIRFSRFEFQRPQRWLENWCWLKASAVICPSELVKRQVLEWAPADFSSKVHCWYDPHVERPVSDTEIKEFREKAGLGASKTVVFVGRLHPLKRIETAFRALREIRQTFADARLLLVGFHDGSGPGAAYEKSLRDLAVQLGISNAVLFLGYMDRGDVPVVMAASDVCVLPSASESFGMVLTEAWSVRTPTVASDVGGCREITSASGGGLLVPVGDHHAFATQILKLLQNPVLAQKHGAAGEAWVAAYCDSTKYAERFRQLVLTLGGVTPMPRSSGVTVNHEPGELANSLEKQPKPKVCIATFYHESHPGAVLQAYALSKTLKHLGCDAQMLAYTRPAREGHANPFKRQILRILTRTDRCDAAYKAFRSKFLKETQETYSSYDSIVSQPPQMDASVCGSDQIWNPALLAGHRYDPTYFLQFGPDALPRISYAASFGGHQPDAAQSELLRKYFSRFAHISVREPGGQALLKQLLGREVALTLDPTLLPENYDELIRPSTEKGSYVLLYGLQHSPEIQAAAKEAGACMNLPVWSYGGPFVPWKRTGRRILEEGPLKWLERIQNASVVVTNSYHGMIFSLRLRKRVIFVPNQGKFTASNDRLFHLSDVLGIRDQVMPQNIRSALLQEMNWDTFDSRLAEQREASLAFLRTAIRDL